MCRVSISIFLAVFVLVCLASCRESEQASPDVWTSVEDQQMAAQQQAQKAMALAARDAMFDALKGRLLEVVSSDGPAAAIAVCAKEAPQIAQRVSGEHGVAIGRTSFRLRNPNNAPPTWATDFVARRVDQPTYVTQEDKLGALLPIRLQPQCLMCHGSEETILPEVKEALAQQYPQDQATGFGDGELRGWFWVEVPAPPES